MASSISYFYGTARGKKQNITIFWIFAGIIDLS